MQDVDANHEQAIEPDPTASRLSARALGVTLAIMLALAATLYVTAIQPAADRIARHDEALRKAEQTRDAAAATKAENENRLRSLADPFTVYRILISKYHWQPTGGETTTTSPAGNR